MSDRPRSSGRGTPVRWCPTVDGEVGLTLQEARVLSKYFFLGGFLGLPFLWFVSCYYFWPVLRATLAEMKEEAYSRDRDLLGAGDEPSEFTPVLLEASHERRIPSPQKDKIVAFYVKWSALCFAISASALLVWTMTFQIGGPRLFGKETWNGLLVYNVADKIESWLLQGV